VSFHLVKLGRFLKHRDEFVEIEDTREYKRLRVQLHGRGIVLRDEVDGSQIKTKKQQLVRAGDFVVAEIDAKLGGFGIAPDDIGGGIVSSHYFLFDIDESVCLRGWLAAVIRSGRLEEQVTARGSTNYAAIRPDSVLTFEIPLPPLPEQRRIVARLKQVSSALEKASELRLAARKETRSLMDSARLRFIGEPRSDWIPLRTYVSDIENGWSPAAESRPADDDEWGVLKVGAVSFGVFDWRANKALPPGVSPIPEYEVRAGDFLMSRANTLELVGACTIVSETRPRLMLSDKLFRFRFRENREVDQKFLDEVLKSPALRSQIEAASGGTSPTMKNISKESVFGLLVPPFDLEAQRRIGAKLSNLGATQAFLRSVQEVAGLELGALLEALVAREIGDSDAKERFRHDGTR
jgi:type I restriction enzyme S subunit